MKRICEWKPLKPTWPARRLSLRSFVLTVILVIGLAARIAIAIYGGLAAAPVPGTDSKEYDSYAWNLAQGHGYSGISPDVKNASGQLLIHPTAYRVPGTSLLWAGLYRCFGHRYTAVRITGCLLDTLTIALLYGIGCMCFGELVGVLAAGIYALWPTALFYSSQLGSEPLYAFLFCGFVFLALRFADDSTWLRSIAAGVILGLALLTRGNAVVLFGLSVPWVLWQFRSSPKLIRRGLAIPFLALLMLIPWTIRNCFVLHSFVPFETGGGDVLLGSYNRIVASNPDYYGYWVFPTSSLPEYREEIVAPNDEVARDQLETRLAIDWMRGHSGEWWYLLESRFRRSWTPFLQARSPRLFRLGMLLSWAPVLTLFTLGFFPSAVHLLRAGHAGWLVHLGVLHFVLTALIFWGSSRFRYPVEGLCIIIASATLVWVYQRARGFLHLQGFKSHGFTSHSRISPQRY